MVAEALSGIGGCIGADVVAQSIPYIVYRVKSDLIKHGWYEGEKLAQIKALEDLGIKGSRYAELDKAVADERVAEYRQKMAKEERKRILDSIFPTLKRHQAAATS